MVKESYKKLIEEAQADEDAMRDLWVEDWLNKNPGKNRGEATRAYEMREGTLKNPAIHKNPKKTGGSYI